MTRLLWIITSTVALGCASIDCATVSQEERFKRHKDSEIGSKVDSEWFRGYVGQPVSKSPLSAGVEEWFFRNPSKCEWAAEVDVRTMKMVRWRYVSDPSLCKRGCAAIA
jgi:hypothetical protein